MEKTTFDKDIKVFYVPASSFPDGIMEAHHKLHTMIATSEQRKFFGISRPEQGVIQYKAAAEELFPGEAEQFHCETMILKTGEYISKTIRDYAKDVQSISNVFREMLADSNLDPEGYCLEWYFNDLDVKCMIRLKQ